jgi:hypothetical protein
MNKFFRNYKVSVPTFTVLLVGVAWLPFGHFGIQTLFTEKEVSEAAPTFDLPASAAAEDASLVSSDGQASGAQSEANAPSKTQSETPGIEATATTRPTTVASEPPVVSETTEDPGPLPPAQEAVAEVVTEYAGDFVSGEHPTSGQAVILGNGTEQRFLRFENFETDNGPDLNVYLFNVNGDRSDFIDLGDLKGNIGEQNYEVPAGVDLDVFSDVSIWCVRFNVGFGGAGLVQT